MRVKYTSILPVFSKPGNLERDAEQIEKQHEGNVDEVFQNFDPNTGKRIREDDEEKHCAYCGKAICECVIPPLEPGFFD